ncbi:antitoxin VapB family protein [Halorientalis halophila]|uniref:antitoxin VapB family protein n=1 Tax=Halorientalis halophila TaxID=3108499 RepID=UPI00300865BA
MGTEYKNVRLTEEAYEKLRSRKREEESFSDVVARLAGERSLLELRGMLDEDEADDVEAALDDSYGDYADDLAADWDDR